jgi:acetate kinase
LKILVINCGSSSIKFEVFERKDCRLIASGLLEKIGSPEARLRQKRRLGDGTFDLYEAVEPVADHAGGFALIGRANARDKIIASEAELAGIGHRVVHGGERFQEPALITGEVVAAIRELIPLAPLHNPPNLLGIEVLRQSFPRVPQVAVFDTMFHQTLPPRAYHYALPFELYENHHVRRYGFHGTSHLYVSKRAAVLLGKPAAECNIITMHIGNGVSHTAIKSGISVDTSMGLTPLEGAVMGTRCGDIDPAIPAFMMQKENLSAKEIDSILNKKSGVLGITGRFTDRRDVIENAEKGDRLCKLALDIEAYRLKKYIGSYMAAVGRLDAVVFTAGVGEMGWPIRERAIEGLEHLGIYLDKERNKGAMTRKRESLITTDDSPVKVYVIPTDEELVFTEDVVAILNGTYTDHMQFEYSFAKPDFIRK